MSKEQLQEFILALQRVKRKPANLYDLGLLIKESQSKLSADKVFKEVVKIVPTKKINYDKSISDEDAIEQLARILQKENWVFLEIKKDIGSPLLNQLKHLANYNSFQLFDFDGKEVFEMKLPQNARVIIFAERDFIENKISYPHFYTLFGPTLSIK